MQFTLCVDFPVLPVPEAVSKTDKSITVRLNLEGLENPKQYKYQVVCAYMKMSPVLYVYN
jgi:hypothetical protein